jgi:hypothetical protein
MSLENWKPIDKRSYEDKLLLKYWQKFGGVIFTEVLVGRGGLLQWANGAKRRKIDGVRIVSSTYMMTPPDIITFNKGINAQEFQQLIAGAKVEVIEVKYSLGRPVLGQVIFGADLLEMEYKPTHIKQVVICEVGDPVLEMLCKKRNIEVWIPTNSQSDEIDPELELPDLDTLTIDELAMLIPDEPIGPFKTIKQRIEEDEDLSHFFTINGKPYSPPDNGTDE